MCFRGKHFCFPLSSTVEVTNINYVRFTSIRSIPAYENAMKESFERCLDLYLCPRVRKKRVSNPIEEISYCTLYVLMPTF